MQFSKTRLNADSIFLNLPFRDCAEVHIGDGTLFGPKCA